MSEIVFEIKEQLGVITEYRNGWRKELNIVSWNDAEPKFDIRDWNPEHQTMTRGITLNREQAEKVCKLLREWFEEEEK